MGRKKYSKDFAYYFIGSVAMTARIQTLPIRTCLYTRNNYEVSERYVSFVIVSTGETT